FRTEEGLQIRVTLADLTLDQYKVALNGNSVDIGDGKRSIGLSRGREVTQYALLARGQSAYADDQIAQYEVPVCVEVGEPEVIYRKGEPAALALTFEALEHPNAASEDERFGRLVMGDASASS